MPPIKLGTPEVKVVRFSEPDKELVIQTANPDMLLWERTRIKHKWPKFDESPMHWMTFLAWAAARRTGIIGLDVTWEAWSSDVAECTPLDDDESNESDAPFPERVTGALHRGASPSDTDSAEPVVG